MLKNITYTILIISLLISCEDMNDYMPPTDETNRISIIAEVDDASIYYTSAKIVGSISNVYTEIKSFGLYYDTVSLSNNTGHKVEFDQSGDYSSFSYVFTNLETNKTYYAVAYVNIIIDIYTDEVTTLYSQEISFTTLGCTTVVIETIEPNNIGNSLAFSGGKIFCDGGSPITKRGVCWGATNNPVIENNFISSDGEGIGEYSSLMNNLEPGTIYYARAYAINSTDTYYGETYSFETDE